MQITSNNHSSTVSAPSKTRNGFGVPDFDPNKPLDFLDDKGNEILDKLLEGRSEQDKISMKLSLNMAFHYIPSLEHGNQLYYVSDISTDPNSVKNTMQNYYDNNIKGGDDKLGFLPIVKAFLSLYTKETTPVKTQFTEETKSKNLEQFYSKEIQESSEKIKVALSSKDETLKVKTTPLRNALEARS